MDINIQKLIENIEDLKILLNTLVTTNKQLTDMHVVNCSQKLDKLLTQYEKYKISLTSSRA